MPYYFAANGRTNGGPGGPSSPTIPATPYNASTAWTANTTLLSQIVNNNTIIHPDISGVGYTSLTTCSNNTASAAGVFAAVGAGGAIFTSPDGQSWTPSAPPTSFSTDLYAVTGYAPTQNATYPSFRWIAVGAGGASIYSIDGLGWNIGVPYQSPSNPANPNNYALHSITQAGGTFIAVGDAGTIISTTDGITWTAHTSGITTNLNGVAHGTNYVAVGDGGKILTSGDYNTWVLQTSVTSLTTSTLRQVTSFGSIIVAVGDNGTVVTSHDSGATWSAQTLGAMNLIGVTAESQLVYQANPVNDPLLGFVSNAQFVAADSTGNAYTSTNGYTWTIVPASTGSTTSTGATSINALVSSGFGYVAAGNAGATAYAF